MIVGEKMMRHFKTNCQLESLPIIYKPSELANIDEQNAGSHLIHFGQNIILNDPLSRGQLES